MSRLEQLLKRLPPELEGEVADFVEFLLIKHDHPLKMEWAGALADWKDKYTSVELQHKISKWREEHALGRHEPSLGGPPDPAESR